MTGRLRFGCMGWQEKDWIGPFYPERTKTDEMLSLYARKFAAVEVDSTFYGRPRETTIEKWREAVPDDFQFGLKVPREVTHTRHFENAEQVFTYFVERVRKLETKLGAILFQCPRSFAPTSANRERLYAFIDEQLPLDEHVVLELRHSGWFDDELFKLARSKRLALTATEGPYSSLELAERILIEQGSELDFAYVRLMGKEPFEHYDRVQADRSESLDVWTRLIGEVRTRVKDVYLFVSDDYSGFSPATVDDLLARLGEPRPQ